MQTTLSKKYKDLVGNEYAAIVDSIKPKSFVSGFPVGDWKSKTWEVVLKVQASSDIIERFSIWTGLTIEQINDSIAIELFAAIKYMSEQVAEMVEFEQSQIKDTTTGLERQAGIEKLNQFASLSLAETICKDWNMKMGEVFELSYYEVLNKKIFEYLKNTYSNNLNKLHNQQLKKK